MPPPSAEKMFTFDMLNFEKLGYAPPPQRSWPPLSDFLDTPLFSLWAVWPKVKKITVSPQDPPQVQVAPKDGPLAWTPPPSRMRI